MNEGDEDGRTTIDSKHGEMHEPLMLRGSERYTMTEASTLKGVSYHTVSRAVRQGRLPVVRLGRMALISGRDLENWQPMRERAPRQFRQEPAAIPTAGRVVLEGALGERLEIARQLSALFEVIHAAASELTIKEFGEVVAGHFSTMFGLGRVSLWILNLRDGRGERVASVGAPLTSTPDVVDLSKGLGKIVTFINMGSARISTDPRLEFTEIADAPSTFLNKPLLIVPLRVRDRTVGALVGDREGKHLSLNQDQLTLAQVLGNQAALAIDNILLRKEEEFRITQLSAILDQMSEQVRACDTNGRLNLYNQSDKAFHGADIPEDLMIGSDALENPGVAERHELDGTEIGRDRHPLARALRGEEVMDWEYVITRSDGRQQRALVNARPLIVNNEITGAVYIGRNVTAKREAEQRDQEHVAQVERTAARAKAIAGAVVQMNDITDPQQVLQLALDCLTAELSSTGGLAFQVLGDGGLIVSSRSHISDAMQFTVNTDPIANATTILALSRKTPVDVVYSHAGRAEQARMTMLGATAMLVVPLQMDDKHIGAFHIFHDAELAPDEDDMSFAETIARETAQAIERIRLTNELESIRTRLLGVIDHFPQAVLIIDGPDGMVSTANSAVTELWGEACQPGRTRADSFTMLDADGGSISPDEHPLLRALRSGERSMDTMLTLVRPDGRLVGVIGTHAPIFGSDGELVSSVSVFQDRSQFALVDRSREHFLSVLVEELINSVAAMRLNVHRVSLNLHLGIDEVCTDATVKKLDSVTGELDRTSVLLGKLLDVSQADIGLLKINPAPTDASVIIQSAVNHVATWAPLRAIRVSVPAGLPVIWDQERIEQSLVAILDNAVRYAPEGPIDVEGRLLESGMFQVVIRDHGPGIAPRLRDRLFSHYYPFEARSRNEDGTLNGDHGLGLDLFVTGHIIRAHHGTVSIGEVEGGGALVTIDLPQNARQHVD